MFFKEPVRRQYSGVDGCNPRLGVSQQTAQLPVSEAPSYCLQEGNLGSGWDWNDWQFISGGYQSWEDPNIASDGWILARLPGFVSLAAGSLKWARLDMELSLQ